MALTLFAGAARPNTSDLDGNFDFVLAALADLAMRLYGDAVFSGTGGDDSAAVQSFVDANKGKTLVIKSSTFAGLLLSGPTYNNTRLYVQGHTLATRPTSAANNFGGAWVGIIIQSCDGVVLDYAGNGNRTAQPDEEHICLVGVAGATNMSVPRFIGREIRGDGMYVSQSSWTSSSATTVNLQIGFFGCYNSVDDGRNALSLIAYDGVSIGTFQSYKVGAVVGGVRQPGGLDIEPNATYQTCTSCTIGAATVRSAGTTCFGVQGKDAGGESYVVTGLSVGALDSVNTLGASATDGTWSLNLFQVNDVEIKGRIGHTGNTAGVAGRIDSALGVNVDLVIGPCYKGLLVGEAGWVRKSDIKTNIRSYAGAASGLGIRVCGTTDSIYRGHISGCGSASSTWAVQIRGNGRALTQINVRYEIDTPKDNNARGYRHEPTDIVTFAGCFIQNCNVTGYSTWTTALDGFGVAGLRKRNINGVTEAAVMPNDGGWTQGDCVAKTNPTKDANNMTVSGWVRLTTGTANVAGTDWAIAHVSHVSPAT